MQQSGVMDVKIVFVTVASVVFLVRHADIRHNAENASSSSSTSLNFPCGTPSNKFDDGFSPLSTWRNFSDVSAAELFNFITHPKAVEKWFLLVSFFSPADHKPLRVGKMFRVVIDSVVFHLQLKHLQMCHCLTLESDFMLKPSLTMMTIDSGNNSGVNRHGSTLTIQLHFRRTSWLFRNLIGKAFLWICRRKIEVSLWRLQKILEEAETYPLFLHHEAPPQTAWKEKAKRVQIN
ncbi:uncharacterized protein LOC132260013 [Phlebotomus argentipes]|uniref:uncharacterized protein LOC132260013 n=1 Tax=Phlebotomus argentipes TaxID=94469 RepID=UPI002892EAFF|nr:uncharacterized protein LOC132260013 [Phlebotomus argentipes]